MPEPNSFDYAVVRLVPHVEREEFINVGIILFCRTLRYLQARFHLDRERAAALAPDCDLAAVQAQLDLITLICEGGQVAGAIGSLSQAERFHWLTAPRSTVIQVSPVHCGLCTDPQSELDRIFQRLVR